MTTKQHVVKKQQLLFELLVVLFEKFSKNLGIKEIVKFTLVSEGEKNLECKMIALPRKSEFEQPHLVLVDHRQIGFNKIDIILLLVMPKIIKGQVLNMRIYGSLSVFEKSRPRYIDKSRPCEVKLTLEGPTSHTGTVYIGNPFYRYSDLYMADIIKLSDELYFSKKYEFVTEYAEQGEDITPLEISGEKIKQKKEA